jgi:hypothetical protein
MCYKGKCDDTTVNVVCSAGSGTYIEYANGLIITGKTGTTSVFTNKLEKKMRGEDWGCTPITQGACDGFHNKKTEQVSGTPTYSKPTTTQATQDEETQRQQAIEKLKGQLKSQKQQ